MPPPTPIRTALEQPVPAAAEDRPDAGAIGRAIVIAVAPDRAVFALETQDGVCAVFCQHAGPLVQVGDILSGAVTARGARMLLHPDGSCAAVGDSGPLSRPEALALVLAPQPAG